MKAEHTLAPSSGVVGEPGEAMPEIQPEPRESLLIHPEFEALRDYYGDLSALEEKEMWDNLSGFFSILNEWQSQGDIVTPETEEGLHNDAP